MKRFLVSYQIPAAVIDTWMNTAPEARKAAEDEMRGDWADWTRRHAAMIKDAGAGGKTKRVTSAGVSDARNDIVLYSMVEAESHDEAANAFVDHPHLRIPEASIEIMEVRAMTGM